MAATARSSWRVDVVATAPALVVVAVALAWSWSYGGFLATHWYPGAVAFVLLLAALVVGGRVSVRELPRSVQIALGAFALFTAWSFASIAWADAQGVAWEGANRTLLYLAMFAVPALSRLHGRRALLVVSVWTVGILVLAVWVLVKLPDAVGPGRAVLGPGLAAPIGYANAEACLWLMAAWPALVLSSRAALPPVLRGLFAGAAVILFDVAILGESRGAVVAVCICLVVLLVALPGRVRMLAALVPVGLGLAVTAPHVIDVSAARRAAGTPIGDIASLATPVLGVALLVAVFVASLLATIAALRTRLPPPSDATVRRVNAAVLAAAAVAVLLGSAGFVAVTGNPIDTAQDKWESFKLGATVDPATGSVRGFGGARYDYYRVALDVIAEHPVRGVGADNFAQDYAQHGRALEFPSYVHSIELRTLLHTGIVGVLLLAVALGAALLGALRAARAGPPLAAAAAAAAAMVFVQWLVQGSADWFWEFPALGGAAFAMLGVACGALPRRAAIAPGRAPRVLRLGAAAGAGALVVACCVSLAGPWMSAIEVQRAGRVWPADADAAFRQLGVAADLNPLSPRPALTEGTIALRLGRLDHARAAFARALQRDPRDSYAPLALGAIASQRGDRRQALAYLRRAARANRQDAITSGALDTVRAGRRIDIASLLSQFNLLAQQADK